MHYFIVLVVMVMQIHGHSFFLFVVISFLFVYSYSFLLFHDYNMPVTHPVHYRYDQLFTADDNERSLCNQFLAVCTKVHMLLLLVNALVVEEAASYCAFKRETNQLCFALAYRHILLRSYAQYGLASFHIFGTKE